MRRCQKEYLKNKRQIDLRISKQIEREVDEEIERVQKILHDKRNVCTSNRIFNLIRKEELKTTEVRMSKNGVPNLTLLF